jgi:hypothetical protein
MDTRIPVAGTDLSAATLLVFLKYLWYNGLEINCRDGSFGTDPALHMGRLRRAVRQLEEPMVGHSAIVALFALALAAPLSAQGRGRDKGSDDIPAGHRPPPGMCRIWVDGVPAGQQPAPTDCRTAIRNRPPNGRVIFGDDYAKREREDKSKLPELLKEFRRKGEDSGRKDDDDKQSEKRKRSRRP